jgi:TRAP transporter TAXI family solute receptor
MGALALLLAPGAAAGAEKLSFSIVTGGTGGVWYPLGGAIGGVVSKNVPNTEASSEATTAAIDNMKLLVANKAGMAFAYDYHAVWANEGKIPALGKKQPIRVVMSFYEQPLHIVTKEGTGIRSVMDLKGRRVSVGAPNSGTEEQADYVLKALGIDWNKDLKRPQAREARRRRVGRRAEGRQDRRHVLERRGPYLVHHRPRQHARAQDGAPAGGRRDRRQDHEGESGRLPQDGVRQE